MDSSARLGTDVGGMNLSWKVLVVDDDPILRAAIREYLEGQKLEVEDTGSGREAFSIFEKFRPEVVLVDYFLPDCTALDLLPKLKSLDPTGAFVILTGHGTIDLAVRAVKEGADHFVTKPVQLETLYKLLDKEVDSQRNRRKQMARKAERKRYERDPFLGACEGIRHLAETVSRVVGSDSPILIQGETGSGKGVLASWFHAHGPRAEEAFVDLNCAGFSRELLDSELFGHEKGSFTGAIAAKTGLFEVAHRGTVFLDEIGDLDPAVQPKLLKVLEDKRFRRLGAVQDRIVDVHLIAATHHDLGQLVAQGKFRSDLFYRVNTVTLRVPPLRERVEDIPVLAERLLQQLQNDLNREPFSISPSAMERLQRYKWPGNIRELRNVLERAALLCRDTVIEPEHLGFQTPVTAPRAFMPDVQAETSRLTLAELERQHIAAVLDQTRGNVQQAALELGIPRSSLYVKIKQYGLRT